MEGLTSDYELGLELQRARGTLALHIDGDKIKTLYQAGCAKLMLPKTYGVMTEAVILNTAGGITGGDRLDIELKAEACPLVATTQTAERLYRSSTSPAKISVDLHAGSGAVLHWLPQETIIFDGAEVDRNITLNMSADSSCLLAETIVLGRQAMSEDLRACHFTDNWRLYREGSLFHAEAFRLTEDVETIIAAGAGGNGARLLTTIVFAGDDAERQHAVIAPLIETCRSACAASCWDKRLVIRLVSPHAPSGRADINSLLSALRQAPMPRVWQV